MEADNQNEKTPHPEKTGKVPASGVISETYKEEVNSQDILGSTSNDPQDPKESEKSNEDDLDTYPLEEADTSDEDADKERYQNGELDNDDEGEATPSKKNDDEFLK